MVTLNQLRINQLRKQYLLAEEPLTFKEVIKNQLGLHSTDYWTPYFSIYARIGDYNPKDLFQALNRGDEIFRINCFRLAVFVVHVENLAMILKSTGKSLYNYYRKAPPLRVLNEEEIEEVIEKIRISLKEKPKRIHDLKKEIPELASNKRFIFRLAMAKGEVVRASTINAKSTLTSYDLLQKRSSNINLEKITENEARQQLIYKYIERFGPVSENDISWWLPLSRKGTKEIINNLSEQITSHEVNSTQYWLEREDYEIADSLDEPQEEIITFLPYEDHFPKAFLDRWYIDQELKQRLFPRFYKSYWPEKPLKIINTGPNTSGEIRPSIWLNNNIIGRWELDKKDKEYKIVMDIYRKLENSQISLIEEKKRNLEKFINKKLVPIS
ncbi:MAG: DNA glycosylase AlkZ-like family protein [Candidatus Hodarchaeota archaeon]